MRRLLIVSSLAVLLCVPAAEAASVRPVEPAVDGVVTDGKHSVAYSPRDGVVAVAHSDGDTVEAPIPPNCLYADVEGSTVLFSCKPAYPNETAPDSVPMLYDSDTGVASYPPGLVEGLGFLAPLNDESSSYVEALGTLWITGALISSHSSGAYTTLYQPRFGTAGASTGYLPPNTVQDLDAPSHARKLCAPLLVPLDPEALGSDDPRRPFLYAKPWALTSNAKHRPVLLHCGEKKARPLPCKTCAGMTLTGPWLAWGEKKRLFVRDLRTGRTRQWTVPRTVTGIALTLDAAFVTSRHAASGPPAQASFPPATLYRAALR